MRNRGSEVSLANASTFAGHQTFALRSGWLKKGYDALQSKGASAFSQEDALVTLGVGKNMVTSIRHWMIVTGMASELKTNGKSVGLIPTSLAERILADDGFDPYLEKDATLWLLHCHLCSTDSPAYTWYYAVRRWRRPEIYRQKLADAIEGATVTLSRPPSRETITRDVDCFFHTYVGTRTAAEDSLDCPLAALRLIVSGYDGAYHYALGPKPRLSPAVFAWALHHYWMRIRPHGDTISAVEIIYDEDAPGVLFKLDEESVLGYLEALSTVTNGLYQFEDTAQIQQVVRMRAEQDSLPLLEACYARH